MQSVGSGSAVHGTWEEKFFSDLFEDKQLVESLGGSLMRCDPACGKFRVKGVPVVRPQMYGAVVNAQQTALRNEVLADLGRP